MLKSGNDHTAKISTIFAGFSVLVFVVIEAICKAIAGPRPSLNESAQLVTYMSTNSFWILSSVIADTFVLTAITVFVAGFLFLAYKKIGRMTMTMIAAALFVIIYATITLLGDGFDAGTALNATQSVGDATVIRTLIEAHILIFGPMGGIILAGLSTACGIVILESRIVSRWVALAGFVVAALNIIAIPAAFNGYGAWNNQVALAALVSCALWVITASIALLYLEMKTPAPLAGV